MVWNHTNRFYQWSGGGTQIGTGEQKIHVSKVRKLKNSKTQHLNFIEHPKLSKKSTWAESYMNLKKTENCRFFAPEIVQNPWNPGWPKIWQWYKHVFFYLWIFRVFSPFLMHRILWVRTDPGWSSGCFWGARLSETVKNQSRASNKVSVRSPSHSTDRLITSRPCTNS